MATRGVNICLTSRLPQILIRVYIRRAQMSIDDGKRNVDKVSRRIKRSIFNKCCRAKAAGWRRGYSVYLRRDLRARSYAVKYLKMQSRTRTKMTASPRSPFLNADNLFVTIYLYYKVTRALYIPWLKSSNHLCRNNHPSSLSQSAYVLCAAFYRVYSHYRVSKNAFWIRNVTRYNRGKFNSIICFNCSEYSYGQ